MERASQSPAVPLRTEKRVPTLADPSPREVLKEAQELVVQILGILDDPTCETSSAATSFGLARAHARTLLDQLARMTDSR